MSQICIDCLGVGIHEDTCKGIFESFHQFIDEINNETNKSKVNLDLKTLIATSSSEKYHTNLQPLIGDSPIDREEQVLEEEMTYKTRGRPIKNKAQLLKDFNIYLARQLDIKEQGSISKKTFFHLIYRLDKSIVLSKLQEITSTKWIPTFKGNAKQVQAKMKAYRHKCRELFHKFKKERWASQK